MKIFKPKIKKKIKSKYYFCIKKGNTLYALARLRGTLDWQVAKSNSIKHHIVQISFKDPWWKPRGEFINDDKWRIYGWLFFYVGWALKIEDENGEYVPATREAYENRITLKEHYNRYDKTYFILSTIIEILLFIPPCYILFSHNYDPVTTIWLSMVIAVVSNLYISRLIRED